MAGARYREGMTVLIVLAVFAVPIAAVVGFVAWRDRRTARVFVDPSVSRDALVQADRQGVQGRMADTGMLVTTYLDANSYRRNDPR